MHAQPSPFLRAALSCLRPPLLTHMPATEASDAVPCEPDHASADQAARARSLPFTKSSLTFACSRAPSQATRGHRPERPPSKSFTDIYLDTLRYTFYEEVRLRYALEPSPPASLKEPMSPGPCLTMHLCCACAQAAGFCWLGQRSRRRQWLQRQKGARDARGRAHAHAAQPQYSSTL